MSLIDNYKKRKLITKKENQQELEVIYTCDIKQIREALTELLFAPDERLKPKIVSEIVSYFENKFSNPENN